MRTKLIGFTLLAGLVASSVAVPGSAQMSAPFQSRSFVTDGVVAHVDSTHDRLTVNRDNGQSCLLDTSQADIMPLGGSRAGVTPDLVPGLRVHIIGRQLSSGLVEATQIQVLKPALRPVPTGAFSPPRPIVSPVPVPAVAGEDIQLRGTVETLDTRRGVFAVRVRDHTRTIYLADDTDLSGMALRGAGHFPVNRGDRVTVWGSLQPDGGVLAGAVSKAITPPVGAPHPNRVLFGKITSTSNRFMSRDIKIRLADETEVKIKVRHGLAIRREGRVISVHDLRDGDEVRTTGSFDGNDFNADHLDVLYRDKEEDTLLAPTRGL